MFNTKLYFVDTKDTASRFFIELVHNNGELSSTFHYEIIVDFVTNESGERELRITSIKEIYDIISFIYSNYGEQDISKFLMGGKNKDRILSSLDKLATKYEAKDINNISDDFKNELSKFINIYKESDVESNSDIYKGNNAFIRDYLSRKNLKQKDMEKELPSHDR